MAPLSLRTDLETRRFTRLKQPAWAGGLCVCVGCPFLLARRLVVIACTEPDLGWPAGVGTPLHAAMVRVCLWLGMPGR